MASTDIGSSENSGYDFVVDADNFSEFISGLTTLGGTISSNIRSIYSAIGSMGVYWTGDSYDEYVETAQGYKEYLEALENIVGIYQYLLNNQFTEDLEECYDALDEAAALIRGDE